MYWRKHLIASGQLSGAWRRRAPADDLPEDFDGMINRVRCSRLHDLKNISPDVSR